MTLTRRPNDADLERLARRLGEVLRERQWRLATAESSTGGLIGHAITMIPGASDYYAGGAICYSNLAKEKELGVPAALIAEHGAVSSEVAGAMADGAWRRFAVDVGVSVTGIAGPEGGSAEKPVGLVHFCVASDKEPLARKVIVPGSRADVRSRSVTIALHLVRRVLGL